MSGLRSALTPTALASVALFFTLPFLLSRTPASVASLDLGTDEAFASSGLNPRENLVGGAALRWTGRKASFRFEGVGPGRVEITFVGRDHRTPLTLTVNGAIVGTLAPGEGSFSATIDLKRALLDFGIQTLGFDVGGRTLGTQFISVRVNPIPGPSVRPRDVPVRLWLALGAVVLMASLGQVLLGLGAPLVLLPPAAFLIMVLPAGLWRSSWLYPCALQIVLAFFAAALASGAARGTRRAQACLLSAAFLAITIHAVLPLSPLLLQRGDTLFHSHKLGEVARGNIFLTSRTDHHPPFEIPYGFSFYAPLVPWASSEARDLRLVRLMTALSNTLSLMALTALLGRVSAPLGAASVLLWALTPVNIRSLGFGNLSNVFAQAVFVLFLSAAGMMPPGRFRAGLLTFLAAFSATAHLSSFIVLFTLLMIASFSPVEQKSIAFRPLLGGVLLAIPYYAAFLPTVVAQLPRVIHERGGSSGVFDPWRLPNQLILGMGWPLVALLVLALLAGRIRMVLPFGRSLALAGLLLALVGLVSPVEVRYLLALTPLLVIVASSLFADPAEPGSAGPEGVARTRRRWPPRLTFSQRPLAAALFLWAVAAGARVLLKFVPVSGV